MSLTDEVVKAVRDRCRARGGDGGGETALVNVVKTAEEQRFTLGLAYASNLADISKAADGFRDVVGPEVLEQTAWSWMKASRNVGLGHLDGTDCSGEVVESYIFRGPDWRVTSPDGVEQVIKAGDWLLGVQWSEQAWPLVKQGLVKGFSPQGGAKRAIPSAARLAAMRRRNG